MHADALGQEMDRYRQEWVPSARVAAPIAPLLRADQRARRGRRPGRAVEQWLYLANKGPHWVAGTHHGRALGRRKSSTRGWLLVRPPAWELSTRANDCTVNPLASDVGSWTSALAARGACIRVTTRPIHRTHGAALATNLSARMAGRSSYERGISRDCCRPQPIGSWR